jgi:hypothetical protein
MDALMTASICFNRSTEMPEFELAAEGFWQKTVDAKTESNRKRMTRCLSGRAAGMKC